jgi:putative IMPACT (imprinted ancient) family translation regulator
MDGEADALADELLTINSIYPDSVALLSTSDSGSVCTLQLPSTPEVLLRLEFPKTYPEEPPIVLGTESIGTDAPKGYGKLIVEKTRIALAKVWRGETVMFDLVEEMESRSEHLGEQHEHDQVEAEQPTESKEEEIEPEPPWTLIPATIDRKSVFLARCARVSSPAEAKRFIAHLIRTDKKAAKATHNISAYRIKSEESGALYQDCDDDGETAAGGRMLHLMQLMDVWNVLVVVSRWYGGIHLGPDRFRIINNTARDVLVAGGFVHEKKK